MARVDDELDVGVLERLEPEDASPAEERRVDLEVRVLGRRPDERDRAVLDLRQEGVLLGLVEAVDLVEEEDGRRAAPIEPLAGPGDRRPHVGDAAHDGAQGRIAARRRPRPAAARASSCPSPAAPTGPSTRGGRDRSSAAARHAHRRGAAGRRTRPGPRPHARGERAPGRRVRPAAAPTASWSRHPGVSQARVESRPSHQRPAVGRRAPARGTIGLTSTDP